MPKRRAPDAEAPPPDTVTRQKRRSAIGVFNKIAAKYKITNGTNHPWRIDRDAGYDVCRSLYRKLVPLLHGDKTPDAGKNEDCKGDPNRRSTHPV